MDEKNWNDLPPEIKLECIKWMNFQTRWSLVQTARTEKQLVESKKCEDEEVDILRSWYDHRSFSVNVLDSTQEHEFGFNIDQDDSSSMESILKMGKIGCCYMECDENVFEAFRKVSKLTIKQLTLDYFSKNDIPMLEKCRRVEKLRVNFNEDERLKYSDLQEAHKLFRELDYVTLTGIRSIEPKDIAKVIQKWLKDKRWGMCNFLLYLSPSRRSFKTKFADRLEAEFLKKFKKRKPKRDDNEFYIPMGKYECIRCCLKTMVDGKSDFIDIEVSDNDIMLE